MPALEAGKKAPSFTLPLMGGGEFSLDAARAKGAVLLIFFKVSCPTCQYAMPFYDRLFRHYKSEKITVVGVSQDSAQHSAVFAKECHVTMPIVLDDQKTWTASNAFGITNVPTAFLIKQDGTIQISSVSWAREDFDQMSAELAKIAGVADQELFKPSEQVVAFKPG